MKFTEKDLNDLRENNAWIALKVMLHNRAMNVIDYMIRHPSVDTSEYLRELMLIQMILEFDEQTPQGVRDSSENDKIKRQALETLAMIWRN